MNSNSKFLLKAISVKKYFPIKKGFLSRVKGMVKAVDDVSLEVFPGETVGLVGESGCGKTTFGRCLLRAIEPTAGSIQLRKKDGTILELPKLSNKEMRKERKNIQMIFQDPYSSLDPRMTVFDIISEPLLVNKILKGKKLEDRVKNLMKVVGLETKYLKRYPHAFSGGQRQRIGIARALATNPRLIVADEPVSALDVSIQAQVLNLLQELQQQFNLTYIFIAHDLSVVEHISNRIAVMYVGKISEIGNTEEVYHDPRHPYTEALLSAVPKADPKATKNKKLLEGEVANPADPPSGCYFHPRCKYRQDVCSEKSPVLKRITETHYSACHFADTIRLSGVEELKVEIDSRDKGGR